MKISFDLETAKNGAKVVTRDGCNVTILRTDLRGQFPIAAIIERENEDFITSFTKDGKHYSSEVECAADLFIEVSEVTSKLPDNKLVDGAPSEETTETISTKIKSTPYVDTMEIGIAKMSITYVQQADCNSPDQDDQFITFETEDCPSEDGISYYFNIKIPDNRHWSFDDPKEITELCKDFISRLQVSK